MMPLVNEEKKILSQTPGKPDDVIRLLLTK